MTKEQKIVYRGLLSMGWVIVGYIVSLTTDYSTFGIMMKGCGLVLIFFGSLKVYKLRWMLKEEDDE